MKDKLSVCIIGSTGVVGSAILHGLINSKKIKSVISVSRSAALISDTKLKQILLDNLNFENFQKLDIQADVFISALGTTLKKAKSKDDFRAIDKDINIDFAKFAKVKNANEFYLVSSIGADKDSFLFYSRIKGEIEESIRSLDLSRLVILRPSLLLGKRDEFRFGEYISVKAVKLISFFLPSFISKKLGTYPNDISMKIIENIGKDTVKNTVISDI